VSETNEILEEFYGDRRGNGDDTAVRHIASALAGAQREIDQLLEANRSMRDQVSRFEAMKDSAQREIERLREAHLVAHGVGCVCWFHGDSDYTKPESA
jgi:hypothetical protein